MARICTLLARNALFGTGTVENIRRRPWVALLAVGRSDRAGARGICTRTALDAAARAVAVSVLALFTHLADELRLLVLVASRAARDLLAFRALVAARALVRFAVAVHKYSNTSWLWDD